MTDRRHPSSFISDPSSLIPVGIAVVEHEGHYLVGLRGAGASLAGLSEFPGGKCRPGEAPQDCAARECREETGLEVAAVELLLNRRFDYEHGRVDLYFWLCRPLVSDDVADDHGGFRWVPARELASLEFPAANAPVIALLSR